MSCVRGRHCHWDEVQKAASLFVSISLIFTLVLTSDQQWAHMMDIRTEITDLLILLFV